MPCAKMTGFDKMAGSLPLWHRAAKLAGEPAAVASDTHSQLQVEPAVVAIDSENHSQRRPSASTADCCN